MAEPLVTIITITLNSKQYLKQALDSVIMQDYPSIEHIIIDGASSDGTVEIIKEYVSKYPQKIRFISEPDRGPGDAWNKGIKMAQGEILGWLGADDSYREGVVKEIVGHFMQHPEAHFIYGGAHLIDEHGRLINTVLPRAFTLSELINFRQTLITPSTFYRKEVMHAVGPFDDLGNDIEFFIKVAKKYSMSKMDKVICNFRIHPGSQTNGSDIQKRKMWLKEWCLTSRRHGGSIFSGHCVRYYIFSVLAPFLPLWNSIFIFMSRLNPTIKQKQSQKP